MKAGLVQHIYANKSSRWTEYKRFKGQKVRGISPVGEEMANSGKDLPKSQMCLKFRIKDWTSESRWKWW